MKIVLFSFSPNFFVNWISIYTWLNFWFQIFEYSLYSTINTYSISLCLVQHSLLSLAFICFLTWFISFHVLCKLYYKKKCSEDIQQTYRRTLVPKCDFNKVASNFIAITLWHVATLLNLVSAIFYQIYIFSPNDSPSQTMKNVFYFI